MQSFDDEKSKTATTITFRTTDTAPSKFEDDDDFIANKVEQIQKKDLAERYWVDNESGRRSSRSSSSRTFPRARWFTWSKSSGQKSTLSSWRTPRSRPFVRWTIKSCSTTKAGWKATSKKDKTTSSLTKGYGSSSSYCMEVVRTSRGTCFFPPLSFKLRSTKCRRVDWWILWTCVTWLQSCRGCCQCSSLTFTFTKNSMWKGLTTRNGPCIINCTNSLNNSFKTTAQNSKSRSSHRISSPNSTRTNSMMHRNFSSIWSTSFSSKWKCKSLFPNPSRTQSLRTTFTWRQIRQLWTRFFRDRSVPQFIVRPVKRSL